MKRTHFYNLIAGLALIAFSATGLASDKMSDKIKDTSNSGGSNKVSVIVQYHAKPDQAEDNRLNGLGATDKRAYGQLKMRALKINANKLADLVNDPDVRFVTGITYCCHCKTMTTKAAICTQEQFIILEILPSNK